MRLGILTGGGDCPGLNAVIRAVVRKAQKDFDDEIIGFRDGWAGVLESRFMPLDITAMRGALPRGGTILGTSRSHPAYYEGGFERARMNLDQMGIDCLIAIGGDGTLAVSQRLIELGGRVIGVPKTIDNDIALTDFTFGFNTAVQIATDLIDRLHTTAESHNRVMVVEVMGRNVGHVATHAGIAGGATVILVPEYPFDIEVVCEQLRRRHSGGRYASIVVVAEGARPREGTMDTGPVQLDEWGNPKLGGMGELVGRAISDRTGFESRVTVLGHVQRGGTPSAYDRVLCTRFGVEAAVAAHDHDFGKMVALKGEHIVRVPLSEVVGREKPVAAELFEGVAEVFFP
ncbi:MAG TPA: ATP-dependent 6-phosphofructokinase [Acidimicrobiales bacterium]|nr:ATP-dependent 6-phosphofructokinase [Acidimicrobiales bacterium]